MNDQIQGFTAQDKELPAETVFTFDADGQPVPVKVIGTDEVQDTEYSEDSKGN